MAPIASPQAFATSTKPDGDAGYPKPRPGKRRICGRGNGHGPDEEQREADVVQPRWDLDDERGEQHRSADDAQQAGKAGAPRRPFRLGDRDRRAGRGHGRTISRHRYSVKRYSAARVASGRLLAQRAVGRTRESISAELLAPASSSERPSHSCSPSASSMENRSLQRSPREQRRRRDRAAGRYG